MYLSGFFVRTVLSFCSMLLIPSSTLDRAGKPFRPDRPSRLAPPSRWLYRVSSAPARAIFQTEPPDPAILSAQYTVVENKSSCKLQPEEATRDKREQATAPTCGLRPRQAQTCARGWGRPRQAGPCARAGRRPRKGMAAQGPAPAQEEDSSRSQAPAAGACRLRARGWGLRRRRTCSRPAAAYSDRV